MNLTTGGSSLTDFQSDNLAIDVVIKIGADAASSSYTARLSNLSDNVTASSGEFVGINQTIYEKQPQQEFLEFFSLKNSLEPNILQL